jgi:hypothetical protein
LIAFIEKRKFRIGESGHATNVDKPGTELHAPVGFHRFFKDGAYLCLGTAAVLSRPYPQCTPHFVRQITDR